MKPNDNAPRPYKTGDFPPEQKDYWDRLDTRVKCWDCTVREGRQCPKHGAIHILRHHCDDFRRKK